MSQVISFGNLQGTTGTLATQELRAALAICLGLGNKDIARVLECSPSTVKKSIERLFFKLGVSTRAAVMAEAMRRGFITLAVGGQPAFEPENESSTATDTLIA